MKGFLERMQWKMAGAMQGRRGADSLSNTLVVAGIVCLVLAILGIVNAAQGLQKPLPVIGTLFSFIK